jgi:hypothetical protein
MARALAGKPARPLPVPDGYRPGYAPGLVAQPAPPPRAGSRDPFTALIDDLISSGQGKPKAARAASHGWETQKGSRK